MRPIYAMSRRSRPGAHILQFAACLLIIVGYFGPWIPHKTAGLTMTAYELSEFAKFFPQVQDGTVPVVRALFVTPLLAAAVCVGLLVNRAVGRSSGRFVATAVAALLPLFALPPLESLLARGYRLQLALVVGAVLLVLTTLLSRGLVPRLLGILMVLLALAGAIPALWQLVLLRPLVVELYNAPVGLGWGLIVCAAGSVLVFLPGIWEVVSPGRS